jgi:hypothetical protein
VDHQTPITALEQTTEELAVVRAALHAYRDDFGHDEADTLRLVKQVSAKADALAEPVSGDEPASA